MAMTITINYATDKELLWMMKSHDPSNALHETAKLGRQQDRLLSLSQSAH
jgi:hypothetical protein